MYNKKEQFKIALVQMDSTENEHKNIEILENSLEKAHRAGAKFIVFPESIDYIGNNRLEHAKNLSGNFHNKLKNLSQKYNMYIHCGSIVEDNNTIRPYNTSFLYSPKGECIGEYRKIHLFDVTLPDGSKQNESSKTMAGEEISIVESKYGLFGFAICYDIRFPEMFRKMSDMGAQLIFVSANFTKATGQAHWETLLRARAIENGCYIAACNQTGKKYNFEAYGNSMIIDPWGTVIEKMGQETGILYAQINLDNSKKVRDDIPVLKNQKKEVYDKPVKKYIE